MRLIYILIIGLHEVYNLIKLNAAHMVKMPGLVVVWWCHAKVDEAWSHSEAGEEQGYGWGCDMPSSLATEAAQTQTIPTTFTPAGVPVPFSSTDT